MASTVTSTNMAFPIPVVGDDAGPQWAYDVNACLNIIDGHDHSPGSGVQITPSGMNINADLTFQNTNNAIGLRSARFYSQSAALALATDLRCLYVVSSDLYYNDGSGNQVRITQSGGVAGSPGSIASLASPASATYVSATPAFVFQSNTNTAAHLDGGSVILRNITSGSYGITLAPPTLGSNYTITLPALPAATHFLSIDSSGNIGSSWVVDNSTVEINSSTLQLKDGGITAAKIASGQITQVKMGSLGQQFSSSCGTFTSSSTSAVDVTNLTVTITTTGRPVFVAMVQDSTTNLSYLQASNSSATAAVGDYLIIRASTQICKYRLQVSAQGGNPIAAGAPPSSVFVIDAVAAGTYTYKVQVLSENGTTNVSVVNARLVAYEL